MKHLKLIIKKLISFLSITLIFITLSSFTSANISLKHSGKANAIVAYTSNENYNSFKKMIDERVYQHNTSSGYSNAITIKSIKKNTNGYDVSYKLRRIDKVVLNGTINLDKFKNMTRLDSESYYSIIKSNKGDVSCNAPVYFDNILGKVVISRDTKYEIIPYDTNKNVIDINTLIENGNNSKDNSMMLMFKLFNFENVTKVTLKLPGNVRYYGGNSINVIDNNTVEITPASIKAKLTINKLVIVDGISKYETVVETKVINSFIGYIVYDKTTSPLKITLIIILSLLLISLFTFSIIYIYKTGVKEIKKQEAKCNEYNK